MDDQFKSAPPSPEQPTTITPSTTPPTTPTDPSSTPPATNPDSAQTPVVTPPQSVKPKKNFLKALLMVLVLVIIAAGAYLALNKVNKNPQPVTQNSAKKSVDLVKVGVRQPFITAFYPKSETSILPAEINSQIFEGLTKYQNENQVAPNLAVSWTNPSSTTWSFKLDPSIKFHNGHALTAQAVKASLDALAPTEYGQAYESSIKTVTAKDNQTVEITTSTPDPLLPNELANLWIYDTAGTQQNDPANGTGPYTIKPGTSLTADSLDLVAVNDYHGGTPLTKEIQFKYYADDKTITQDAKDGKLDIADLTVQSAVNDVKQSGYTSYLDKNPQVYFLIPNSQKANSPLAKLAVRKAIYEGLDPSAIMKADSRSGTVANQFVPQAIPGYNPAVQRPNLDPAQAKKDLAAAGYPNGFTLTFTYYAPHADMAQEVQKEMNALGIKLTLDPETSGPQLQQKALGGQTDLFYFAYASTLIDSSDVIQPLLVDSKNYQNPDINKSFSQASTTFNSEARLKLLQDINKMAMDDVAGFPLFVPDGTYFAVKPNLVVHTDNLNNYLGIDFWKVYSS